MIYRMFAWVAVFGVGYSIYIGVSSYHSPFSVAAPAIVRLLPAAGTGCGDACKKDLL